VFKSCKNRLCDMLVGWKSIGYEYVVSILKNVYYKLCCVYIKGCFMVNMKTFRKRVWRERLDSIVQKPGSIEER
jgi:hypothetical protein